MKKPTALILGGQPLTLPFARYLLDHDLAGVSAFVQAACDTDRKRSEGTKEATTAVVMHLAPLSLLHCKLICCVAFLPFSLHRYPKCQPYYQPRSVRPRSRQTPLHPLPAGLVDIC